MEAPLKAGEERPTADPARTLYAASKADPRDRAAVPRARTRGRASSKAGPTSDVTRFPGVLAAAVAGAAGALAAALLLPPLGGHTSPGPLSRPHLNAKVECAACHASGAPTADASRACASCHGTHGSQRRGHERAAATGAMRCATCHAIHRSDQGVAFAPDADPVRFAPGIERVLPGFAFRPAHGASVAIVTAGSCKGCHDIGSTRDPIARCLEGGQGALGDARPIVCFDEHQPALPADVAPRYGSSDRDARSSNRDGSGAVCAFEHTADRAILWDAAREAAARVPVIAAEASLGAPPVWMGAGLAAAALAFAGVRSASAIRARRRAKAAAPALDAMLKPAVRVRLPQIDVNTCLGCYACVDACPYDVLEIERYIAVVTRPEACCGLTLCEQRCPNGSLQITDGAPIGDRPRLGGALESLDVPGLFLAGDVTGLPLIKNAILQGAHAATAIAESLDRRARQQEGLDLVIIGAGPAGISAALRAKELGLSFEVIEQGSVAQSIRSFPRGKLVFDQPLELPMTGALWLKESTKEELLSHWLRIVRKERLPIREDTRMTHVERDPSSAFLVTTEPREGGPPTQRRARRVLLAIGQRGSPRRLPFPLDPDVEARVHYHLADARSFEGRRVIVIGLGDVAMEAAIALSRQPGTEVTVVHRGDAFSRGKARNITEIRRLAEAGRIAVHLSCAVSSVTRDHAVLRGTKGDMEVGYDAILVMIGSIPPWDALRGAGVRRVGDAEI